MDRTYYNDPYDGLPTEPDDYMKPCPFCGGQAYVKEDTFAGMRLGDYYIKCPTCDITISKTKTCSRGGIFKIWNRRVSEKDENR